MKRLFGLIGAKSYMRGGYRWYELKLGRRRWMTWQAPFFRTYSIAWSQAKIDADVEQVKAQVQAGLRPADDVRRAMSEERYDIG